MQSVPILAVSFQGCSPLQPVHTDPTSSSAPVAANCSTNPFASRLCESELRAFSGGVRRNARGWFLIYGCELESALQACRLRTQSLSRCTNAPRLAFPQTQLHSHSHLPEFQADTNCLRVTGFVVSVPPACFDLNFPPCSNCRTPKDLATPSQPAAVSRLRPNWLHNCSLPCWR